MARCGGVARARRLARPPGRRGRRVPVPPRRPRLSAHTGARAYRYSLGRTRPCGVWCSCSEYAIRRSDSIVIGAGVCRGGRIDFAIGIGPIGRAPPPRPGPQPVVYGVSNRKRHAGGGGRGGGAARPRLVRTYGTTTARVSRSPRQSGYRAPGAETRPAFNVRRSRRPCGGTRQRGTRRGASVPL